MNDSVQRFISELIRAANEVDKLTPLERTRLLQRAATTVRDQGGRDDLAHRLSKYGELSDNTADQEISIWLLEAVEIIKAGRR